MNDVAIIGGGIVGLAAGYRLLQKYPDLKLTILEKESSFGVHQTGHNSGVIHSGIYYKPGSYKAHLCKEGRDQLLLFCDEHNIPYNIIGKVIIATEERELSSLKKIFKRGQENQVDCEILSGNQVKDYEPHAQAIQGIYVKSAGIIDYGAVVQVLCEQIRIRGGTLRENSQVTGLQRQGDRTIIQCHEDEMAASLVINCCGLQSDRMMKISGGEDSSKIIPFRGDYFELSERADHLVKGLIYPVPDPDFPFLGVHLTRSMHGSIHVGPNAVLNFSREGYSKFSFDFKDTMDFLRYPGFWKLAAKHHRQGLQELSRSLSKRRFLASLQRLVPEVKMEDLKDSPPGIRAQSITKEGELVDDFLFHQTEGVLHVLNSPSPAATASLAIGGQIIHHAESQLTRFRASCATV